MTTSSYNKSNLYTIIALGALTVAFLWGFFIPERRATASAREEILELQHQIQQVPLRVAKLQALQQDVKKREEFLDKSSGWLPESTGVSHVLHKITQLARAEKLSVTNLKPLPDVTHASYRTLPFEIQFRGSFVGIARFLKGLETLDRAITCEKLTLTSDPANQGRFPQAELHFSVYASLPDSDDSNENNTSQKHPSTDTKIR
ncbi:MAG: hypothetical protein Tsb009_09390 [Planctomycetaceae bacterium]